MGLVQAELERRGIVTASVSIMPQVTEKIRPPRALSVPFPLGFAMGKPNDAPGQRQVLLALLALLSRTDVPVLEAWVGAGAALP